MRDQTPSPNFLFHFFLLPFFFFLFTHLDDLAIFRCFARHRLKDFLGQCW